MECMASGSHRSMESWRKNKCFKRSGSLSCMQQFKKWQYLRRFVLNHTVFRKLSPCNGAQPHQGCGDQGAAEGGAVRRDKQPGSLFEWHRPELLLREPFGFPGGRFVKPKVSVLGFQSIKLILWRNPKVPNWHFGMLVDGTSLLDLIVPDCQAARTDLKCGRIQLWSL